MQERIRPTKSGLFAIELMIAVGVFVFCAAICLGIFAKAEVMSRDSADLNRAVNEARNAAECFKVANGDLQYTAELCGGHYDDGGVTVVHPDFSLRLVPLPADGYAAGELTAFTETQTLLRWTVAALPEAPA